ncbi:siderophore-interacting protein [Mucilaginibacter sp. SMC90]|uniref:siderophore-interacting protein n=1 Tax=Mucilaginibacter sp. SMC90 TaxID=2929803 RepID=UPI001FB1C8D5|nr:siderophore-interacting protein [Mucilaginibacter sp. SMC90]UOE52864.1 siderophore-interacting protein [Mucilaginibacter sp. SMC90]
MRKGVQSVFTVKEKTFLTPHYIRVKFAMNDEQLELFSNVQTGGHNKLFFPDETRRTYTTRHIDFVEKELWVDFVAHGDNGPASAWANRTSPGDRLAIGMKEGRRPLFPEVDEYLFIGDSTALPVIGAMLEQLPANVQVQVIMEIPGKEDELKLCSEAHLATRWVYNSEPEQNSDLAALVRNMEFSGGNRFVFVAAEYDTAKNLKNYFRNELAWPSETFSVVSYWKRGESEDQSSAKRREERQLSV